jgi:hypothetical protein
VPRIQDSPDFDPSSLTPSASLPRLPLALAGNFNTRLGTEPMEPLAGRPPGPDMTLSDGLGNQPRLACVSYSDMEGHP